MTDRPRTCSTCLRYSRQPNDMCISDAELMKALILGEECPEWNHVSNTDRGEFYDRHSDVPMSILENIFDDSIATAAGAGMWPVVVEAERQLKIYRETGKKGRRS